MNHYYSPSPTSPHKFEVIRYRVRNIELAFTTDAGVFSRKRVDFGSALLIENLPPQNGRLLDLGCGYGPIGISLAALNPGLEVVMADINKRALTLAAKNIELNRLANVSVVESNGFSAVQGRFSTIVTNPPIRAGKKTLYPLFQQCREFLQDQGQLWLVIQKKQGAPSALNALEKLYANCRRETTAKGYWLLCCKR